MCRAFSCIVTQAGQVYWRIGMDSHDALYSAFKGQDTQVANETLCAAVKCEITPDDGYLAPDGLWTFELDEGGETPCWWTANHEAACWRALRQWKAEVYSKINLEEARHPINPFALPVSGVTEQHLSWLREWASVWDSVWDSVGASVGAYVGALFSIWSDGYPYQSVINLWRAGLVASYDGKTWRLHAGETAKIVWEGIIE